MAAKRWRRLLGLFGGSGVDGIHTTQADVAQFVPEPLFNRALTEVDVAQVVLDDGVYYPQTPVRCGQFTVEVLRSMHCQIAPPPVPPAPQCPPQEGLPVAPGGGGCVTSDLDVAPGAPGCEVKVPRDFGT